MTGQSEGSVSVEIKDLPANAAHYERSREREMRFQTFKPERVCSPSAPKATYQLQATATEESQLEMGKKLELPFEAFRELQSYCISKNMLFLSTPFDYESADFLEELRLPAFCSNMNSK